MNIDGVPMQTGDRILLTGQRAPWCRPVRWWRTRDRASQSGIYVVTAGTGEPSDE